MDCMQSQQRMQLKESGQDLRFSPGPPDFDEFKTGRNIFGA